MARAVPLRWLMVETVKNDPEWLWICNRLARFCADNEIGVLLRIDPDERTSRITTLFQWFDQAGVALRIYDDSIPDRDLRRDCGYNRHQVLDCFAAAGAVRKSFGEDLDDPHATRRYARALESCARYEAAYACVFIGDSPNVRRTLGAIACKRDAAVNPYQPPIAVIGAPKLWIITGLMVDVNSSAKWLRPFEAHEFLAALDFLFPRLPARGRA